MRLAIYCDGNFVVTAPQSMNENIVEQFIIKKARWIIDKLEYFKNHPTKLFSKNCRQEYFEYKEKALSLAQEKVYFFNERYGFEFNKICIKNQKTRWGSCSRKGNLNFNYKIALLPEKLADYVIIHELCHLKEFNHSRDFWKLVSESMPDYLKIRKELRQT